MTIQTKNPATGEVIASYEEMSESAANIIIDKSYKAFQKWGKTSFPKRAKILKNIAELLRKNKKEYATIITHEMGKPIKDAISEIEKCAWVCDHFAEFAKKYLKKRLVKTEMSKTYVTYQPLGVIFAIMPWNFPFWQVFRFAAPTLMAGNCVVLKHAPISTGAALAIEKLLVEAGLPENVFRTLIINNEVASKVIANDKIAGVTLTGSVGAGKIVGANAAGALKKVVLELGGSDPYLILEDADLEAAAEACVRSRMNNTGQVCIAAKRLIIVEEVFDKLQQLISEKMKNYIMGDPLNEATNFGPMARQDLRDEVHRQVEESVTKGAKLIMGGEIPNRPGFYYPPTILTDIKKNMPAYNQKIFGPVVALIKVKNEKEAIKVANDTSFGLAAAVFTQNIKRGEKLAVKMVESGSCAVNTYVSSDPRLPFGGIKKSGYGRELSAEGIRAFTNIKTILIK